jgi:hypothetical protein
MRASSQPCCVRPLQNKQAPEPHSDARAVPASVSWDLADPTKWEAVLDASQTR